MQRAWPSSVGKLCFSRASSTFRYSFKWGEERSPTKKAPDVDLPGKGLPGLLQYLAKHGPSQRGIYCMMGLRKIPEREVKDQLNGVIASLDKVIAYREKDTNSQLLFTLGQISAAHPSLLSALHSPTRKQALHHILQNCATDPEVLFNSREVSRLASAQVHLKLHSPSFWQSMNSGSISQWNAKSTTTVLFAAARLSDLEGYKVSSDVLSLLQTAVSKHAPTMTCKQVSSCAWSLFRLEAGFGEALEPIQEAAARTAAKMDAGSAVKCISAFVRSNSPLDNATRPLVAACKHTLHVMNSQQVSNAASSIAKTNTPISFLDGHLEAAMLRTLPHAHAGDTARMLWALATLKAPLEGLKPHFEDAMVRNEARITVKNLRMYLSSYAKLNVEVDQVLSPIVLSVIFRARHDLRISDAAPLLETLPRVSLPDDKILKAVLLLLDSIHRAEDHITEADSIYIHEGIETIQGRLADRNKALLDQGLVDSVKKAIGKALPLRNSKITGT